ncbi:MAG: phosphatase PAP2 family protein, partial [Bacteroidales bacterium]|nr:phosphatase PAP2 family protein [Bacteroidales bacterium]
MKKVNFNINRIWGFLKNIILICFIIQLFNNTVWCQQDTSEQKVDFNKKYIASYWHDTKKIVASPIKWRAKEWSIFAGILGASVVTYVYDKEIYDFFQRNKSETTEIVSKYVIEPWGSGLYSIPLLGIIYLSAGKNNHHKNVALTGLKAFLLSGGAAVLTKHIFHRHRPSDNEPPDPYMWQGPYPFTMDYTSFPSGHTTTAFAVASVLAQGYKDKLWVGITSYSIATLVGLSRLHDGKHWATDVIA